MFIAAVTPSYGVAAFYFKIMISVFDQFMATGRDQSNVTIGTESVTLSNGVVLTGVWNTVSERSDSEDGGEQFEASASVVVPASSSINRSLIGKKCTYNGKKLKVSNVEIGTTETTVFLNDETEGIKF